VAFAGRLRAGEDVTLHWTAETTATIFWAMSKVLRPMMAVSMVAKKALLANSCTGMHRFAQVKFQNSIDGK
jgi:hypothetical protein